MRKEKLDYPFLMVPYAVLYDKRLKNTDKIVYLAYVSRCMRSNHTEVGEATLARDLAVSVGTIKRSVAILMKVGLIVKRRRIHTSSVTEIIDVRNLYEDISKSYFNVTPKVAKDKKKEKKSPSANRRADSGLTSEPTVGSPVGRTSAHQLAEKYIKGNHIKSEIDKDPPGRVANIPEEKIDLRPDMFSRLDRLPGDPSKNLTAFTAIAVKYCKEHGLDHSHLYTVIKKAVSLLLEWNARERLRDTPACFRKIIGNVVCDLRKKLPQPCTDPIDLSAIFGNESTEG